MTKIGDNPEIRAVKEQLIFLKEKGLVKEWELPYENILTRLTAAIFFLTPAEETEAEEIWKELSVYPMLEYGLNNDRKLSRLQYQVTFNKNLES